MIKEKMGIIMKQEDGSEIVNYNNESFPAYIFDGYMREMTRYFPHISLMDMRIRGVLGSVFHTTMKTLKLFMFIMVIWATELVALT